MAEDVKTIRAACPLFACRICRTKTGWKHQSWCSLNGVVKPGCLDCCYRGQAEKTCIHPAKTKEAVAE
ncbi:MAG: hypothetical protein J5940_06025 [Clostridia bacterium]|nr:hypothetical protein [Clostridia bacterium]